MGVRETTKNAKIAKVRLEDVLTDTITGEWGSAPAPGTGVFVLRTTNFTCNGEVDYGNVVSRDIPSNKVEKKRLLPGDLIVEKSGGTKDHPVGRVVYFNRDSDVYLCNNFTQAIRPNREVVNSRYLLHVLLMKYSMKSTESMYNKTTGIQNLKMSLYLKQEIPLPSLPEQKRIAEELDQICELKKNADERLALMDQLVKSRFVEMFGDGCLSDEKQLFSEICEFVTVGIANSATHAYAESGVPMLRNQNIREGSLDDSDLVYIKSEFAEKYRSKTLKENDLLIVRTGYPGVSCVVPKKYEGAQTFTTLIARLRDLGETDPVFVCHYLNSPYGKEYVDKSKVGIAQQNFGARALEGMPIFIPHISLQREFAAFVAEVDKSKFVLRETVVRMETLYKAKLQEYFG